MKVASFNGCKVYNLSSGKTMPEWLSQAKKRTLQKDEEYRRRLELIQDFEMPTASQCVAMTRDGEHIIVTGTYPPIVKCYTTSDLALKFQRGLTCEVVAMETLSEDYGKLVFLQSDRTLNFHAPYGQHYNIRVPKFGRDLIYNWDNCDLYVCGTGNEIYRLNLEAGQFREPFNLKFEGCNKMHINPIHQLLACGGEEGFVEFWDPRSRKATSSLRMQDKGANKDDITAIKFDTDGLTLGVGTSSGFVHIYDIRSSKPVHTKEHQYGLPIVDISYHNASRTILTTDKKLVKIWERDDPNMGKIVTNIETPADINNIAIASDNKQRQSGVLMMAGEQSRVMAYFVPQLGPAPRWCSFLENLTEELEENTTQTVYEDYKFVTKQEIEDLGATGLIGTAMLKGYMHGFFMEMKLYNKLRAVSKPFEYEEYRKKKIQDKIEEKRQSRISTVKRLPKVNKDLAEKLMKKSGDKSGSGEAKELIDPRFAALFEREEFQQDTNDIAYKLRHPVEGKRPSREGESDDELDIYEEVNEKGTAFDKYEDDEDDVASRDDEEQSKGQDSYDEDSSDEETNRKRKNKRKRQHGKGGDDEEELGAIAKASLKAKMKQDMKKNVTNSKSNGKNMKMFTLAEGVTASDVVFGHTSEMKMKHKLDKKLSQMSLAERMKVEQQLQESGKTKIGDKEFVKKGAKKDLAAKVRTFKSKDEGLVREISYMPKGKR